MFDTLDCSTGTRGVAGTHPPQALADRTHRIWVDFISRGHLPWPAFEPSTRMVYSLKDGEAHTEPPFPAARFLAPL